MILDFMRRRLPACCLSYGPSLPSLANKPRQPLPVRTYTLWRSQGVHPEEAFHSNLVRTGNNTSGLGLPPARLAGSVDGPAACGGIGNLTRALITREVFRRERFQEDRAG